MAAPIATTSPCACSLTLQTLNTCWTQSGSGRPHVLDYLDRLFNYCVASEWGRQARFQHTVNIIRSFKISRDRSVTVANLVDELPCARAAEP